MVALFDDNDEFRSSRVKPESQLDQGLPLLKNAAFFNEEDFGQEDLDTQIELITPAIAQKYLGTQKNNRPVTRMRVKEYAQRMLRGEWRVAQPIAFSIDGDLIDGQHRLHAVIASKTPCKFLVVRGYDPGVKICLDSGQSRRVAQQITISLREKYPDQKDQFTNINEKTATIRAMFLGGDLKPKNKTAELAAKKIGSALSRSLSPDFVEELYLRHKKAVDFANHVNATAPVKAVIARAYYHENHERLEQFMKVVSTGNPVTLGDSAAIQLHKFLAITKVGKDYGGTAGRLVIYKKTISALSNFLVANNITNLREATIEPYPVADFD